jgi:hypothetical protein
MAKPARGLPDDFVLDLPDERPVQIGDFLDEQPPAPIARRPQRIQPALETSLVPSQFRPEIVREREEEEERKSVRPVLRTSNQPSIIRYQLNLTPKSKWMFDELIAYVQTYSPQDDASASEVFQGVLTVLHNAMGNLELSELPKRGAWGSVTAKNFPGALSEAFERAIVHSSTKRNA